MSGYMRSELRVLTVGTRPSPAEFPTEDPLKRLPRCDDTNLDRYRKVLSRYFGRCPNQEFFDPTLTPLLKGLGASFYEIEGTARALHTNLSTTLTLRDTEPEHAAPDHDWINRQGLSLWHDLVTWSRPDIIVLDMGPDGVDHIEFSMSSPQRLRTIRPGHPDETVVYSSLLHLGSGHHSVLVYGGTGPQPFSALSQEELHELGAYLRAELITQSSKEK